MKTAKGILFLSLFIIIAFSTAYPAQVQGEFPSNANLTRTTVGIEVFGFGFASGLQPNQSGNPNGNGFQLVEMTWAGSGFIVKRDGTLVTNYHVARRALRARAVFDDKSSLEIPSIKVYDGVNDIAVLKMRANRQFSFVTLGNSDNLTVRDSVLAVGNPLNMGINMTEGRISQVVRDDNNRRTSFRHTATIAPGSSGGPLYKGGAVIGINVRGTPPYEFYEAIPINKVRPLLTQKYNTLLPLEGAFPTNPEAILQKAHEVFARNGEVPAAQGDRPGVVSIPADFYALEDLLVLLVAEQGRDLAILITDTQKNILGFGDIQGQLEGVLLSNDSNAKPILVNLLNYQPTPARFGMSVNSIVW